MYIGVFLLFLTGQTASAGIISGGNSTVSSSTSSASESNTYTSSKTFTSQVQIRGEVRISSSMIVAQNVFLSTAPNRMTTIGGTALYATLGVVGDIYMASGTLTGSVLRTISVSSQPTGHTGTPLLIKAGNGTEAIGGAMRVEGGDGTLGNPGAVAGPGGGLFMKGGAAGVSNAGGAVVLKGGAALDTDQGGGINGSSVTISGGDAPNAGPAVSGPGGSLYFYGGFGYNSSSGSVVLANTSTPGQVYGRVGIGTPNPATLLHMSSGAFTMDGTNATLKVGTMTFGPTSPPQSQALCLLGGLLGHCTGLVGATGGCTCVAP